MVQSMSVWPVAVTRIPGGYLAVRPAEITMRDSRGMAYPKIPWVFISDSGEIYASWCSDRDPNKILKTLNPPDFHWVESSLWHTCYPADEEYDVLKNALKKIGREELILFVDGQR